jgi:RNA polymerase sigma factor (sigma-70 family)
MSELDWLAGRFEENRTRLRSVALRMLGSASEADDAVQEAWLRVSRADAGEVENLAGWLTTITARVCLNMLQARRARPEEPAGTHPPELPAAAHQDAQDPGDQVLLADSVGQALLVVLDTLSPAERVAFVLHDMFAVPFEDIAPTVGRSPAAARQLASRARRRVQGAPTVPREELARQRELVGALLTALRARDLDGILAVLDPDLVFGADAVVSPPAGSEIRGARAWATQAITYKGMAGVTREALVDGALGVVVAPRGRLQRVLVLTFAHGLITRMDVIADPARLRTMELAVLDV